MATAPANRSWARTKGRSDRTDQFAELLAEGLTLSQIAERLGITKGGAKACFARIRKALGEQAR